MGNSFAGKATQQWVALFFSTKELYLLNHSLSKTLGLYKHQRNDDCEFDTTINKKNNRMNAIELTLPEWAFLDGTSHLGNLLAGRDVLQHIPSFTLIEIFTVDETKLLFKEGIKTKSFTYVNRFDEEEEHILAVHFSLAPDTEVDEILDKAIYFYCEYLDWEDESLQEEDTSKQN